MREVTHAHMYSRPYNYDRACMIRMHQTRQLPLQPRMCSGTSPSLSNFAITVLSNSHKQAEGCNSLQCWLGTHLQLLELGQVCTAANLTQAEQGQAAGDLIVALHCAEQGLDCCGGLGRTGSSTQHSNALGNVVLGSFAHLPVVASCQQG